MSVIPPKFSFSDTEHRLLTIIGDLLEARSERALRQNYSLDEMPLSRDEVGRLVNVLDQLSSEKKFLEKSHFVDRMVNRQFDKVARKIYFRHGRDFGKTSAVSTSQWQDLAMRLGMDIDVNPIYYANKNSPQVIDLNYFYNMEQFLFSILDRREVVADMAHEAVLSSRNELIAFLHGDFLPVRFGDWIIRVRNTLLKESADGGFVMKRRALAACWATVANLGVFGFTRDWTATSGLSALAGQIALSKED